MQFVQRVGWYTRWQEKVEASAEHLRTPSADKRGCAGGEVAHCGAMKTSLGKNRGLFGTPDRSRTCDLQNRNLTLYPAELRVRVALFVLACGRACARRRGEAPEACSLRTKHYHFSRSAGDCPAFWGNGADGCTAGRRGSAGRAPCKAGRRRRQRRRRTDRQSTSRRPPARTAG